MVKNIVAKFGGTSVKTPAAIEQVARIVEENPRIRVVILSAVGGITNLLRALCRAQPQKRKPLVDNILHTHLNLVKELEIPLETEIKTMCNSRLSTLPTDTTLSRVQIDEVLALGEDMSSMIVHAFLQKRQKIPITRVDARDFVVTDDEFGKANPNLAATKERMHKLPRERCVMQGFIGATHDKKTTTLGRDSSDYSAALVAEALHVGELLIYTDVPGVFTADPRIVTNARTITAMSFQEMAEMANFGAKILHPTALEPCMRMQIPVRILSTFETHCAGTYIRKKEVNIKSSHVRAITMRKGQTLVKIKSMRMLNSYGFLAHVFNILAQHKISVDLITTSEVSVALTIDNAHSSINEEHPFEKPQLMKELEQVAEIVVENKLTLLAIVGHGLTIPGMVQKIFGTIKDNKIRLACYGASSSSIGILVPEGEEIQVINVLHQGLLAEPQAL